MQAIVSSSDLNRLSMKEARKAIIQNLITKWATLDSDLNNLNQLLVEYENKLKAAREDGDTSENSAYEQAINNVSTTQANIHKTQKLKYDMSLITEPEFVTVINASEYDDIIDILENTHGTSVMSELVFRHFDNDVKKLATCSRANIKEILRKAYILINNAQDKFDYNEGEQEIVGLLEKVLTSYKVRPYKPCGKVVLYSIVRVDVNGSTHTFMICPDDISYVHEGIIAANSELALNLLNGEVGDSNVIREGLRYTIKEIY